MPLAHPPRPVLSGVELDRASAERKDPAWVAGRLRDPAARAVAATHDAVLVADDALLRIPAAVIVDGTEADGATPEGRADGPILLGLEHGAAVFAADLEGRPGAAAHHGGRLVGLREAGALLAHAEGGLAAYAVALLNWHRVHGFCSNCGEATELAEAGLSRRCPRCGASHFPRTDPAVIMLVAHGDRLLLGRRPGWPDGRYSVLAGFVSPGESLEEAVVREVREESGIDAHSPRFVASQPWPFPSSLMLGFEAASDGGEPRALDGELEDVRWFTRADVRAAIDGDPAPLVLPPSVSIARLLIERWAAAPR